MGALDTIGLEPGLPRSHVGPVMDPVLDPAQVAEVPNLWLLDARDDADFLALPVSGTVHVPVADWTWAARNMGTGLDDVGFWQAQVDALGIGAGDTVAVFDDGRLNDAARVWFILQYFGLDARLVNGSATDLLRVRRPPVPWAPVAQAVLRPGAGPVALVNRDEVRAWLAAGRPVLDARTSSEHAGVELRGNPRGGRMPGARSLPHAELLDGRRLREAADLRRIFAAAGFEPEDPFITHCDRGGRSALTALAALRAGFLPPAVYFMSFADWARDAQAPLLR